MKIPSPEKEHQWLQKLVGDWTFEVEAGCKPGEPPIKLAGVETVRAIGGLWIIAEGRGEMPGGGIGINQLTLGYDTASKRFVGTWLGSMMTYLWVYTGSLNEAANTLTLDTEGPDMNPGATGMTKYREVIRLEDDVTRTFTSSLVVEGKWTEMMKTVYRRKG